MQKYFFIIFLSFILMVPAFSAGGDGNSEKSSGSNLGVKKLDNYTFAVKKINKAKKLEKKGKTVKAAKYYQKALDYLLKANAEKPANPDTLNYLGFSNRKLGNYDDAEIYYLLGLEFVSNLIV